MVQAALAVILDIKGRSNMGRYQLLDLRLKVHGRLLLKFTMYSTLWDRIPVGGEIFRTCPDRPWGPPSLLYNGYRVFPGGKERPGREADPSPPSSAVGHERVEPNLYSPYGPYGLYRASVPVQGCTLPLPFTCKYAVPKSVK